MNEFYTTKYERNLKNRKKAIEKYGIKCKVCVFDFFCNTYYCNSGCKIKTIISLHNSTKKMLVVPIGF